MSIYTNAKYVADMVDGESTDNNIAISCTINDVVCSVPTDVGNSDYAEILKQVEAGDLTIADAD
jgi:hypothetical protein